jgi:membrane protein required for colicin V production
MIIDIVFAILLVLALIRGFRQGLIVGLFSFIAIIIGLAAAIKLSAAVAMYIGKTVKISEQWLPLISFAVVFLIVILLVRLAAKAIQRTVEIGMMGWLNRLGGMIFFAAIYITVFSILLFYAEQMKLIRNETIQASVTYRFVQPWGPKAISSFGEVLPFFRNMFTQLEEFFGGVSGKMQN